MPPRIGLDAYKAGPAAKAETKAGSVKAGAAAARMPFSPAVDYKAEVVQPWQAASAQQQAAAAAAAPIAFNNAPFVRDGTAVNYGSFTSEYGAYIAVEGDFDHKNGLDVVTIQVDGTFNLLLNNGKGGFTKSFMLPSTLATFTNTVQGFAADVNGDGYLDVIASTSYPTKGFLVWINNGDGTFAAPVPYALPATADPGSLYLGGTTVADVNHDGHPDVVVLGFVSAPAGDPVSPLYAFTFLGNGDGTFPASSVVTNRTQYYTPQGALQLGTATLADMNGDGNLDLVTSITNTNNQTTFLSTQYIGVSVGDGTGHFADFPADTANVEVSSLSSLYQHIQAIDLNHDGHMDVLWSDSAFTVYTSLGNGDGTLQPPITAVIAAAGANAITTGDFNQDGYSDIAVFANGLTAVYAGKGDGTFGAVPISQYPDELAGNQPTVAQDLDGDGIADLIIARPFFNQLVFLKGNGDGTFQSESLVLPSNTALDGPTATEPAINFNVLTTGDWSGTGSSGVFAQESINGTFFLDMGLSDGHGGLTYTRSLSAQRVAGYDLQAVEPIAADFNGDGRQDVVWTTSTGVAVGLSKGDGTFTDIVETTFPDTPECALGFADAADLNADGHMDLVFAYGGDASCDTGLAPVVPSGFFVLRGDGTGHFTVTFQPAGQDLYKVRIASLKNDGVQDLIFDDLGTTTPEILSVAPDSSGAYTGAPATLWAPGSQLADLLVQDINGDGIPDLTLLQEGVQATDDTQPGVLTLLGAGDGTFHTPQFLFTGTTGITARYADFNQDGLPDLAVNMGVNGDNALNGVAVFPNLGQGAFAAPLMLPAPLSDDPSYGSLIANEEVFTGDFNASGAPGILLGSGGGAIAGAVYFNQRGVRLQLSSGTGSITQFDAVTLTVQATSFDSTVPAGTVSFSANGTALGSAPLSNGFASLTTTALPAGTVTLTAQYGGSADNSPVTSNALVITVVGLPPAFTLAAADAGLSVTSAAPAETTLQLTPNQSFNGPVTLSCSGLPAGASCAFSPSSVPLAGGTPGSVKLTVAYSRTTARVRWKSDAEPVMALCLGFLVLGPWGKRRRRSMSLLGIALLLALPGIVGLSGCAGGDVKTPIATNITVVATGVSGGVTVSQSTPLQLTIQP